jgi:hypothetical protein
MPMRLIPPTINKTAISRPMGVMGTKSPYPTVVIVVIDHHLTLYFRWCAVRVSNPGPAD